MATEDKLLRADMVVRAANGYQRPDGGVVWSGMLWVRGLPIASFHNDGNGGCCSFKLAHTENARAILDEVTAFAVDAHPEIEFEQLDQLVGELWDEAFTKGVQP